MTATNHKSEQRDNSHLLPVKTEEMLSVFRGTAFTDMF